MVPWRAQLEALRDVSVDGRSATFLAWSGTKNLGCCLLYWQLWNFPFDIFLLLSHLQPKFLH